MIKMKLPLILASGSPRRKEILDLMGLSYTIDVSDADESCVGGPEEMVLELSGRKAHAVAKKHEAALILAADTLVFGDGVLGKPASKEHAKEMLMALSDNWHSVYTGLTLINTKTGRILQRADRTRGPFVKLSEADIEAYITTGESMDKAGAYAIQGMAGMFIDRIEGSHSNVIGLPMAMLRDMLIEMNADEY